MSKLVLEVVEADALKVGDHVRIGGRARTFVGDGGTPRERVTLQRRTPDAEERTLEVPLIWWRVYEIMEFDIEQRGGGHVG
jgi:hypothetical protein